MTEHNLETARSEPFSTERESTLPDMPCTIRDGLASPPKP